MSAIAGLAALVLAAVVVIQLSRLLAGARRRHRLNRAMHEVRRPIQALALAIESGERDLVGAASWMDQVRGALQDLDAEINGGPRMTECAEVSLGTIADGLESRWGRQGVRVVAPTPGAVLRADPRRLGAALDNLVANALGHGEGSVSVRALSAAGIARLEVRDDGAAKGRAERAEDDDPRHGHGLAVAGAVAKDHGGMLAPPYRLDDGGTVTSLTLPASRPR